MKSKVDPEDDLYTVAEFAIECKEGHFINYDGLGYYSDGFTYDHSFPAIPSDFVQDKIRTDFHYVVWFNR